MKQIINLTRFSIVFALLTASCNNGTERIREESRPASDSVAVMKNNGAPRCYESISPHANRRSTQHEYIVFREQEGVIRGKGSGYDEGDPAWDFDFSGTLTNDSVIQVRVCYTSEGMPPLTTSETWIIDTETERMRIAGSVPRRQGPAAFYQVEPEDLPDAFQRLLSIR